MPDNGLKWSAAGTVFRSFDSAPDDGLRDTQVLITDSANKRLTLTANSVGNFYTAEPLQFPIFVEVQGTNGVRVRMNSQAPHGACNVCHNDPPDQGAVGRVFVPQE
jgi:hypothetical protein